MSDEAEVSGPEPTKVIQLDPPIVFRGGKFDTLTLREPASGEVRKAQGQMRNNMSNEGLTLYNMHLISAVTGIPFPVIELLPISKHNEAAAYLERFTSAGLETGGT